MDRGAFVLLSTWSAREQLSLLDAVEQYGYGNWSDVSRRVSDDSLDLDVGGRQDDEAEAEFNATFIQGILGTACWHEEMRSQTHDHTPKAQLNPAAANNNNNNNVSNLMLGYLPLRDDFEVEHANDAEILVSHLQPLMHAEEHEDRELETALQIAHVEMYRDKLTERQLWKKANRQHNLIPRFVKENPGLLEGALSSSTPPKPKKQQKRLAEVERLLKTLSRFQTSVEEHSALVGSVHRERELRNRLRELIRYRKHGVKSLRDAVDFDYQRVRRSRKQKQLQQLVGNPEGNASQSSIKFVDLASVAVANSPSLSTGDSASPATESDLANVTTFTLSQRPSFELLSGHEQRLCTGLRLTPSHYITYKTCLLTNHLQKKKGQTPKPLNPAGLDKSSRKIIFQYLMRSGWISAY